MPVPAVSPGTLAGRVRQPAARVAYLGVVATCIRVSLLSALSGAPKPTTLEPLPLKDRRPR
ncbi:hypothetical protein A176_000647 [Myxococcus hansupus]|uniref:Uncharacterized protein n=1 Tax=Pseudomyxococcus hansupus TaxID=1297742 RepID=A0A0H4WQV6_9BACT|nr:hypothetical protein A176_000647 [Myxococcus hansupus]